MLYTVNDLCMSCVVTTFNKDDDDDRIATVSLFRAVWTGHSFQFAFSPSDAR